MQGCQEATRLLGQFLALELEPAVEAELRAHLSGCARCRAQLEAAEPATALALRLPEPPVADDEAFVAGVLAGIRQRRAERAGRRRWLGMAAALLLVVLGGYLGVRRASRHPAPVVASGVAAPVEDLPFVEVEGERVTVVQFSSGGSDTVQVALIIDPGLKL